MCKYCENREYDAHLLMEKTGSGSIGATIINRYIVVAASVGKFGNTVFKKINFCPMCGRDLRGE